MLRPLKKAIVWSFAAVLTGMSSDAFAQQSFGRGIMLNIVNNSLFLTDLVSLTGWLAGAYFAIVAIYKFKDHVDNPVQNPLSAGVKRFVAGGMLLSLPFMIMVLQGSMLGDPALLNDNNTLTDQTALAAGGTAGELDMYVLNFIGDIAYPTQLLLSFFVYLAAAVLLVVGISRLTRKMDEGPRGPAGFGTIMTFITAGVLFTWGDMMGAFANTIFGAGGNWLETQAVINTDLGMAAADLTRVENVIQAVMYFVLLVGMIAFVRGWFVLRAFADGQQGATLAQGLTFLIGGALAMNLGEVVNALQATIGVSGITFQ